MQVSSRVRSSSRSVRVGPMSWEPWKQGRGSTRASNAAWLTVRCWRGWLRRIQAMPAIACSVVAHYAVRMLLAEAAVQGELDPDRLSFTEGLFELTEMISLALTLEPEEATVQLPPRLRHKMARHVLPARRLRVNRREIKKIYNKYKPKKRQVPPSEPFNPEDQFLDFVDLLDPLAPALPVGGP